MSHALATNKEGLSHIDEHVYTKMFGYKDVQDFYNDVSLDLVVSNIQVPTLAFESKDD